VAIRDEQVSFSLQTNVDDIYPRLRKVQMVLFGILGLMRKLGLPPQLDRAIAGLQRFIAMVNQARLALAALQTARMAAGDPLAWATFGLAAGSTAVSVFDMYTIEGS